MTGFWSKFALSSKLKGEPRVLLYVSSPSTQMKIHLKKLYLGSLDVIKVNNLFSDNGIILHQITFFVLYTAFYMLDTFFQS
jgi:hypothetical protein